MASSILPSLKADDFDLLSLDVFDTLLFRDTRCERSRFASIAARAAAALSGRGRADVAPADILRVRNEVQALSYRTLEMEDPDGDVRLADMAAVQARVLGLDPEAAEILVEAEFQEEAATLKANDGIVGWAEEWASRGKRVIAVSDTYLSAARVGALLEALSAAGPLSAIYSSSDEGCTKRGSRLFEVVAAKEGVATGRMVHCGDNLLADVTMARRVGLQAYQLPRSRTFRFRRKLDAGANRLGGAVWLR